MRWGDPRDPARSSRVDHEGLLTAAAAAELCAGLAIGVTLHVVNCTGLGSPCMLRFA